ncbi:MAG: type secretion system protein [Nevskia sp.]|nr:type secretion system protein [Nevskia sp.]
MIKRRHLIIVGIVAFAWTLLMHAPAANLYGWFAPKNSPTQLVGIEGSLGEGRLAGITSGGRPLLQALHWRLQPLWLLLLRASFQVDTGAPIALRGRIGVTPLATHVATAHISGSLKALLGAAGIGYVPIDGIADGDIDQLTLKHGIPTSAQASLQLRGLNWTLAKPALQLGDFRTDISNDGDTIVAKIQSTAGPMDAQGLAHLNSDGSYDSDIRMKAKADADEMTQNLLHSIGQPDAQGYYHAKTRGQLPGTAPINAGAPRPPPR